MKIIRIMIFISLGCLIVPSAHAQSLPKEDFLEWPKVTQPETRPWTWWWWHHSAAEKGSISTMLKQFHAVGLGGVNIVCVNDVVDSTKPAVDFLSKEYMDLLRHSVKTARSMGMNADMSPVGGWAFGGKFVPRERACCVVESHRVPLDSVLTHADRSVFYAFAESKTFCRANLQSALAVSPNGKDRVLVTDKIDENGLLHWRTPQGTGWALFVTCNVPGSSKVRAATPDWRGYVVNHLKQADVEFYFQAFDKAFAQVPHNELPRAYNNDSWEINLDWSDNFFEEFKRRRGYDLQMYMPEFLGYGDADTVKRVTCDYRETLSDLIRDVFTPTFRTWARKYEGKIIGEVQFEPASEIDVNAFYDIPQADMGGWLDWYFQKGDYVLDQLFMRAKVPAASAHILGKPFVASETYTCMGGLGTPLNDVKMKTDCDFIAGINHTFYHGITYTPDKAHWPGWLFYAGTQLGPFNPQWRHMSQLSRYITRCQSFLQRGRSANDVLFYFPTYDEWSLVSTPQGHAPGKVDISNERFASSDIPLTYQLWKKGIDFDFVTDSLLSNCFKIERGRFVSPGNVYKTVVVGNCKYMPLTTLVRLTNFVRQGGTVVMIGELPKGVPGLYKLSARQAAFDRLLQSVRSQCKVTGEGPSEAKIGKGRFIWGEDALQCCRAAGVYREKLFDTGLRCIRRRDGNSWIYFIVDLPEGKEIDRWIPFSVKGKSAVIYDAASGRIGSAAFRSSGDHSKVYLQLKPNESCIVRIFDGEVKGKKWEYVEPITTIAPIPIQGEWNVSFIAGGETIPHPQKISELTSWTEWKGDQADVLQGFEGTARYEITFDRPPVKAEHFILDLGEVCYNAKVILNGDTIGDLIAKPMQLLLPKKLKAKGNKLVLEITNTAINRTGYLEKKGVKWMYAIPGSYDIEFNIDAKTFVPQKSGLIGPVRIIAGK
jgi:hypothetical protein